MIDPTKPRFSGHTEIDVVFAEPRKTIFIHGLDLHISSAVARVNNRDIAVNYKEVDKSGVAQLTFASEIPAGEATLVFDYDAPFDESLAGLYKLKSGGDDYAVTQFENIDARRAFPGFDEPGFKTPFDIAITAPSGDKVIANTLPSHSEKSANGMTRVIFAPTEALPTYLMAFAVGPFDIVDGGTLPPNAWRKNPLPLRGITAKGQGARIRYALSQTPKIVTALENYFQIGFPFSKLDTLAIPDFASGAMENAGAITYRERYLLMPDDAPLEQRRGGLETQAHEITHQWFGDLVTAKWWDDIWLNEAFATWMEAKAAAMVEPDWEFGRATTKSGLQVMLLDESPSARNIHQPANNPDDIANAFDDITYSKGAAVLSMFEAYVGEEGWRAGIHDYLTRYARGNATAKDFIGTISEHHKRDGASDSLSDSLSSFIDQPGVPLLTIGNDCKTGNGVVAVDVAQSLYTQIGRKPASRLWNVPVCMKGDDEKTCEMLNGQSADLFVGKSCPKILIPNAEGRGYYRYAFEGHGWDGLIAAAASLDPADQLTLFFNAEAALRAGKISAPDFFRIVEAIAPNAKWDVLGELDSGDFSGIDDALRNLRANILPATDEPTYRAFIARHFGPRLERVGLAHRPGETPADTLERQALVQLMVEEARDPKTIAALAA
ncbi:MAG TPA: M1 family metallopeptidase, partial [Rhizomicrobium sp.]